MRELLIASREVCAENGHLLHVHYFLLVEELRRQVEIYGVKITESETRSAALAPGLTVSSPRIFNLIDTLVRGTATPPGLLDVVLDWLDDSTCHLGEGEHYANHQH